MGVKKKRGGKHLEIKPEWLTEVWGKRKNSAVSSRSGGRKYWEVKKIRIWRKYR